MINIYKYIFLGQDQKLEVVKNVLNKELFPHMGLTEDTWINKAKFLGYMTRKLILTYLDKIPNDCRDEYNRKRLELCGEQLKSMFWTNLKKCQKEIRKMINTKLRGTILFFNQKIN